MSERSSAGQGASDRPYARALVVLLACALALSVFVPVPASAGDGATVFEVEPEEVDADPGDSVTIDVIVYEHGDLHGNGIDALSFDLEYDADVLSATNVEHESMLAAGDDDATVDGTDDVDEDAGVVSIGQDREPAGDGATASESAASITFDVADDADPASVDLEIIDASGQLVSSDYPQTAVEFHGTVHVDGGDETDAVDDDDADGAPDGVTVADDADIGSSDDSDSSGDANADADTSGDANADSSDQQDANPADESGGEDPIPGFGPLLAIAGLVGAVVAVLVGRRWR